MRILVTGVTGQVGSALLDALAPAASIVAAGRKELDLAQPDQIASALDRIAAD
jgi:dTDP-4-dehydrorhamnose reductase